MHPFPKMKKKLGFGMMRLPMNGNEVDIETTKIMVDAYMARGFNYFDTAYVYIDGKSELVIRDVLTSRYPRESYVLTDKLTGSCFKTPQEIAPLLDKQLEKCGVDYFDFYLLHSMSAERHERFTKEGVYDIVQELKKAGKIRHVGMSFHDTAEALDKILTDRPEIEVVQLQFNYVDYEDHRIQSRLCYEVCRKHGKPILVMEPVRGGSLANLPEEAAALLTQGSPASYAIRFAAGFEGIVMVLSGMSTPEQVLDNLSFMEDFQPLSEKDHTLLQQVKTIYQSKTRIPCTGCKYCEEQCPAEIPISAIFAQVNQLHKKEGTPKEDYAALKTRADACLHCDACTKICPQHLAVQELVEKSHKELT